MKQAVTALILSTSFLIGASAHAGATFQLYNTPARPDIEVCRDKFGMSLSIDGEYQQLNRVTLDFYESADHSFAVERHPHGYGLDLIDEQKQRHLLTKSSGGFGSCDLREGL